MWKSERHTICHIALEIIQRAKNAWNIEKQSSHFGFIITFRNDVLFLKIWK